MTWVGPRLEAVIAEIRDATDTDARGDVGGRPAGQDRDRDALRPCLRDPGQPPERASGERHDRRRAGVSRALGQGPVEVGDDEQPAGPTGQRGDGGDHA